MNCGIYMIQNCLSGKMYVGSSKNIKLRWDCHAKALKMGCHGNGRLQNAWTRYGESAFIFSVLEQVADQNHLICREQFWIDQLDSSNRDVGYNICSTAGSPLGYKHTEAAHEKMRLAATTKPPRSKDTFAKISAALKGRKHSAEHTEKQAATIRGRIVSSEERLKMSIAGKGRKRSAESVEKTAAAHRGMKRSAETRAKMSKPRSLEARVRMCGRPVSEVSREKARISMTGQKLSAETRKRMSIAAMGNTNGFQRKGIVADEIARGGA